MKILLATGIYPPDIGGPATYVKNVASILTIIPPMAEIHVVSYGERDCIEKESRYTIEKIGRSHSLLLRYWKFMRAVQRGVKEEKCHIVYLQGPVSEGLPGILGAWLSGVPTVMKVVGDYAWEIYSGSGGTELLDDFLVHYHHGKIRMLESIERWTARCVKHVITPSYYLKTVVEKWGVPVQNISVIENAVLPLDILPNVKDEIITQFKLQGKRIILTAVRAVPWKAIDFIIDLLEKVDPSIVLVVAGDGPELRNWKKLAEDLKVSTRVIFLGSIDRKALNRWYLTADLFILPSGYEGFANVIPEAASVGLPAFVSNKGGNPETLKLLGSELITVLPYRDKEAWSAALNAQWPKRVKAVTPRELQYYVMFNKTLEVLTKYAKTI